MRKERWDCDHHYSDLNYCIDCGVNLNRLREVYDTPEYQARKAVENRPCGAKTCVSEFPGQPSRWCSACLIEALLSRIRLQNNTPLAAKAYDNDVNASKTPHILRPDQSGKAE